MKLKKSLAFLSAFCFTCASVGSVLLENKSADTLTFEYKVCTWDQYAMPQETCPDATSTTQPVEKNKSVTINEPGNKAYIYAVTAVTPKPNSTTFPYVYPTWYDGYYEVSSCIGTTGLIFTAINDQQKIGCTQMAVSETSK